MGTQTTRTPLYPAHLRAGAKMVEFAGWEMPLQYTGVLEEHRAVRSRAGLFDVSHMGEIIIRGPGARETVQGLVTNDISRMLPGWILYAFLCNNSGGTIDDILVYCLTGEDYLLVVNAANVANDLDWIRTITGDGAEIKDASAEYALIALQGPRAEKILQGLAGTIAPSLKPFRWARDKVSGVECIISRTGYTGEDGYEIFTPPGDALRVWDTILQNGKDEGLVPAGLGARDTLRLEAGMPLYGHELDENITPLEAGLGRFVRMEKEFIGKAALISQQQVGLPRVLVGLQMVDRGIPRAGYRIKSRGEYIGWISSGGYAPVLDKQIGMGFINAATAQSEDLAVEIRGKACRAATVPLPFYKRREGL
ncbi:MAG: glycine cleavage system aminomethyltransferase GcvT [Bacillota bacterium]